MLLLQVIPAFFSCMKATVLASLLALAFLTGACEKQSYSETRAFTHHGKHAGAADGAHNGAHGGEHNGAAAAAPAPAAAAEKAAAH